jgi:hypothetical protein
MNKVVFELECLVAECYREATKSGVAEPLRNRLREAIVKIEASIELLQSTGFDCEN